MTDVYRSIIIRRDKYSVNLHSKIGATVYYYLFDYRGSNSFISLFMNSTDDIGECLQFVEILKHLQ